jgi:membrane-associated phospholipid phosphatase
MVVLGILFAAPARAQESGRDRGAIAPAGAISPTRRDARRPFRFGAAREVPIVVVGAGTSAAWLFNQKASCLPNCEPVRPNVIDDALSPGRSSTTASDLADVGLALVLVVPHAINAAATWPRDDIWTEDLILTLESALVAEGISQVVKSTASRWAPVLFDPLASDERKGMPDTNKSFWSAHAATAVAAATAFSLAYALRHPSGPGRWLVLVGLETAALAVGALTVVAGDHYATDVIAGSAFGAVTGVTIPLFHTSPALGGFSP